MLSPPYNDSDFGESSRLSGVLSGLEPPLNFCLLPIINDNFLSLYFFFLLMINASNYMSLSSYFCFSISSSIAASSSSSWPWQQWWLSSLFFADKFSLFLITGCESWELFSLSWPSSSSWPCPSSSSWPWPCSLFFNESLFPGSYNNALDTLLAGLTY